MFGEQTRDSVLFGGNLEPAHRPAAAAARVDVRGQPLVIARVHLSTGDQVTRWMRYDSLGRMVLNVDPHATVSFNADPATSATGLKTWRYVYNAAGDLVGTSDARGCGQNFHYDSAGRLVGATRRA